MIKDLFFSLVRKNIFFLLSGFVSVLTITSCGDVKQIQYMQGEFDTAKLSKIVYQEPLIQKGDLLGITVFSDNQLASSEYNQPITSSTSGNNGAAGYLVDDDGNIRLYGIGLLKVEGMSRKWVATELSKKYVEKDLLKNPHVEVRYLNFKITLIGEFNRPGVYSIPSDKVSVLDAIGLAGDVSTYARKDNVLVIREIDGKREFGRMNLLGTDFFLSPYFYLRQNDMVVIDVTKQKAAASDMTTVRNITLAASILSTIAIFLNVFKN